MYRLVTAHSMEAIVYRRQVCESRVLGIKMEAIVYQRQVEGPLLTEGAREGFGSGKWERGLGRGCGERAEAWGVSASG